MSGLRHALALLLAAGNLAGAPPASAQDVAWIWPAGDLPDPPLAEAAVLVESVILGSGPPRIEPRRRALLLDPGTRVTPVVHVQPDRAAGALADRDAQVIVAALLRAQRRTTSGWVQLDFEAPLALRESWRALVAEVRRRLPAGTRLSVTALASWCSGSAWLHDLAADEVVPMFFHLGPDAGAWIWSAVEHPERLHPSCREGAAGFSVQVPPPAALQRRYARRYWFHEQAPRPYTLPRVPSPNNP
jgi:hypothetical protein